MKLNLSVHLNDDVVIADDFIGINWQIEEGEYVVMVYVVPPEPERWGLSKYT